MSNLKVGDKVTIKDLTGCKDISQVSITESMRNRKGEKAEISNVVEQSDGTFVYEIDDGWSWGQDMFEEVTEMNWRGRLE